MKKLIEIISRLPKSYFSLKDIRKISCLDDGSLKVAMSRLASSGRIIRIGAGHYALSRDRVDWEKFALEVYAPSYLSFESALARYDILSQKPYALTLATTRRSRTLAAFGQDIIYHHLQARHFWGYTSEDGILIARPEKAWLDLAYLSLNGYARFDPTEMDLNRLNKKFIRAGLKKFGSGKLDNLIRMYIF